MPGSQGGCADGIREVVPEARPVFAPLPSGQLTGLFQDQGQGACPQVLAGSEGVRSVSAAHHSKQSGTGHAAGARKIFVE